MKNTKEIEQIEEIFSRGIGEFLDPEGKFKEKLLKKINGEYNKDIIIKLGADPTRPDLHLGHAVVLRKLRKLQELGCKIVFIVGDFTTLFGDPTGKSKTRPKMKIEENIDKTAQEFIVEKPKGKESTQHEDFIPSQIPSSIEIEKNMKTYIEQIGKILLTDDNHFSWIKNSDWFIGPTDLNPTPESKPGLKIDFQKEDKQESVSVNFDPNSLLGKSLLFEQINMQTKITKNKLTLITTRGLLWTLQHITHARLIERDMFKERLDNNEELYMHEMLYPVLQGIDSYALAQIYGSCDLEVGGTDQTFNILVGRDVMKANKLEPQAVATFKVLEGLDGKEKMSKSLDNYIAITDGPNDMYGKVMSIPDSSIGNYFELCTFTSMDEVEKIKQKIEEGGTNPRDIKMRLAREIIAIYHGEKAVKEAEENFVNTFQKKEIPTDIEEVTVDTEEKLIDVLLRKGLCESKSDCARLVEQGAVHNLTEEKEITEREAKAEKGTYRIGKKKFIKIV